MNISPVPSLLFSVFTAYTVANAFPPIVGDCTLLKGLVMNQDSSFPPMLPPSTELGALLFALLPCLQEPYRPIASLAYHITELSSVKKMPFVPSPEQFSHPENFISDKDNLLHSLAYYGKLFRMPLLSAIATALQAIRFYNSYKDIFSLFFSGNQSGANDSDGPLGNLGDVLADLGSFFGSGGLSGTTSEQSSPFGNLSPELLSSLFSLFSSSSSENPCDSGNESAPPPTEQTAEFPSSPAEADPAATDTCFTKNPPPDSTEPFPEEDFPDLYDSLYSLLSPEQKEIYDKLMNTDEAERIG